ncbi:hypothetical protein BZA70DRAFT_99911 [Myxozyma melibiosi]|uniref:Secreted peptide n=1 Tax=Myxozyma melibiosi TaxID=54550 RepID=A0ABR1EYG1_9ASCO
MRRAYAYLSLAAGIFFMFMFIRLNSTSSLPFTLCSLLASVALFSCYREYAHSASGLSHVCSYLHALHPPLIPHYHLQGFKACLHYRQIIMPRSSISVYLIY